MNKELVAENTLFLMKRLAISFDEAWDNHTSDNIKSIEDRAFGECTYLKKFFFPKNIEFIGDYCFENCRELSYLWIPDGVKIGEGAFSGCSGLKKVELPFSMKNLDLEYLGLQQDVVTYGN